MDNFSGSALKSLYDLCERNGLKGAKIVRGGVMLYLYADTGYLADGSPIVTLVSAGKSVREIREKVQALLWAWGRK